MECGCRRAAAEVADGTASQQFHAAVDAATQEQGQIQ
jgi:hypothetical protein